MTRTAYDALLFAEREREREESLFLCASRLALCVFDVLLFAEREREEEEESLFLSNNARICLHFVFLHIAKNEKFGLAKRTQRRMDVVF